MAEDSQTVSPPTLVNKDRRRNDAQRLASPSLRSGSVGLSGCFQRPVRVPSGPPALSSRSHSSHSGLPPVPRRRFSGAMLFPVRQLWLLW